MRNPSFIVNPSIVIVQILPTPGPAPAGKAACGKATSGTPRMRPLYVRPDTQGASALSPAGPKGKRPDRSIPSAQAPATPQQKVNREGTQTSEKLVEKRTPQIVRQDKRRLTTARPASAPACRGYKKYPRAGSVQWWCSFTKHRPKKPKQRQDHYLGCRPAYQGRA